MVSVYGRAKNFCGMCHFAFWRLFFGRFWVEICTHILSMYSPGIVHVQLLIIIISAAFDSKLKASKDPIWCNFPQSGLKNFHQNWEEQVSRGYNWALFLCVPGQNIWLYCMRSTILPERNATNVFCHSSAPDCQNLKNQWWLKTRKKKL